MLAVTVRPPKSTSTEGSRGMIELALDGILLAALVEAEDLVAQV